VDIVIICIVALVTSGLTLFSGFGVGTLLLPAFLLLGFEPTVAVASTAIVHFSNNCFKLALMGRHASRRGVLLFGPPAVLTAFAGAWLLENISGFDPLVTYEFLGREHAVTPVKIVIGVLVLIFALVEVVPFLKRLKLGMRYLPLGGALSGFFGGLSGHQGALRSAFLLKCGFSKETFIGTGIVVSWFVDVTRIPVYVHGLFFAADAQGLTAHQGWSVFAGCLAAFTGALLGKRLMKKVTIDTVRWIVAVMLFATAIGVGTGVIAKKAPEKEPGPAPGATTEPAGATTQPAARHRQDAPPPACHRKAVHCSVCQEIRTLRLPGGSASAAHSADCAALNISLPGGPDYCPGREAARAEAGRGVRQRSDPLVAFGDPDNSRGHPRGSHRSSLHAGSPAGFSRHSDLRSHSNRPALAGNG
jgi:hypothetical protein